MAARFITLEGGEGAGKTTQIRRLATALREIGLKVTMTREPGGTPAAEMIRDALLSGAARELGPEGEAVLFAAARADHVETLIRPALRRGEWVLCDRFADSTWAYQGASDGVPAGLLRALDRLAVGRTRPDLTLVFDIDAKLGLERAIARTGEGNRDRFERDDLARHERRRRAFLEIAAREAARCVVIDAGRPEDDVAAAVWQAVETRLVGRVAA